MGSSGRRAAEDDESAAGPLIDAPIWSGPYDPMKIVWALRGRDVS
jgi:hypothetical protein